MNKQPFAPPHPSLSLTHLMMAGERPHASPGQPQGSPHPASTTPALTMTSSPSQGRFVVLVRAGVDEEVVRGPWWSPWWGTHSLALLAISVRERATPLTLASLGLFCSPIPKSRVSR